MALKFDTTLGQSTFLTTDWTLTEHDRNDNDDG
jgi:hypothetical protein